MADAPLNSLFGEKSYNKYMPKKSMLFVRISLDIKIIKWDSAKWKSFVVFTKFHIYVLGINGHLTTQTECGSDTACICLQNNYYMLNPVTVLF